MRRHARGASKTRYAAAAAGLALLATLASCGEEPRRAGRPEPGDVAVDDGADDAGELVNINPDPDGEPWLVGGLREPTEEELAQIPELLIVEAYAGGTGPPERVDNSHSKHFPPIFSQKGGSCAQASAVGYVYTYEVNALRGADAALAENRYPPGFTYNFLNSGSNSRGSWMGSGWSLIQHNGIPTVKLYGGAYLGDPTRWISGHDTYRAGMQNRLTRSYSISVMNDPAKLAVLKQWLYDHGKGSAAGGVASFAAYITGAKMATVPAGLPEAGKRILTRWGTKGGHAMTFVGYDDRVRFDFNQDGKFTNDKDQNGDGVVDLRDWERGALIVVNSWGKGWGSGGRAYLPYRLLPEVWSGTAYVAEPSEGKPKLTLRVKLTHNERNRLSLRLWMSNDLSAAAPTYGVALPYPGYSAGAFPMRGKGDSKPIEIAYDATRALELYKVDLAKKVKLVLQLVDGGSKSSQPGKLWEWGVRRGQGTVVAGSEQNVPIKSGQTAKLSLVLGGGGANVAPVAAAGPDLTVKSGETVTLDGSGSSDPDGSVAAHHWEQTSGPQVALLNETSAKTQFIAPEVSAQASLAFRLTVTDDAGLTASDTVKVTVKPDQGATGAVGETGTVDVSQSGKTQWHTVKLARSFKSPVVFARVVTYNGAHPVTVRIKDVTAQSFKLQLDEWEYLDQSHTKETVAYAVLEQGRHVLADKTVIDVGTLQAGAQAASVAFSNAFGQTPVVVAQAQTASDPRAVVTRLDKVTASGFQVELQGEEKGAAHGAELVGYLAVQTAAASQAIEIGRVPKINHTWSYIQFNQPRAAAPVLLAAIQTLAGGNTAGLRFRDLGGKGVSVFIEEEQSGDSETQHVYEDVGYVLLPGGFIQ
jgi:hypothetical protein